MSFSFMYFPHIAFSTLRIFYTPHFLHSALRGSLIKRGTWNFPEHPGTSNNYGLVMRKICKIKFSKTEKDQQFGSGNAETT